MTQSFIVTGCWPLLSTVHIPPICTVQSSSLLTELYESWSARVAAMPTKRASKRKASMLLLSIPLDEVMIPTDSSPTSARNWTSCVNASSCCNTWKFSSA